MNGFLLFFQVFRPFLLTRVRFFWFPLSFGVSCRLEWYLMSPYLMTIRQALQAGKSPMNQSSQILVPSGLVGFNVVFLAAPHFFFSVCAQ